MEAMGSTEAKIRPNTAVQGEPRAFQFSPCLLRLKASRTNQLLYSCACSRFEKNSSAFFVFVSCSPETAGAFHPGEL
jgi:hypothetical protein